MSVLTVADECTGWLNGTLGTWSDPHERAIHMSASGGFTSQSRQDKLLWDGVFSHLRGRAGRYLDVAANHYKRISNTYFLDKCAGWSGLCVEPNPIYHAGLRAHRSCRLAPTCASDREDELELLLPPFQWLGGLGGVGNGSVPSLLTGERPSKRPPLLSFYPPNKWKRTRLRCIRIADELLALGWQQVDFLSLDVENHEEAVLRGIDWSRVRIDRILCERGCADTLRPMGYQPLRLATGGDSKQRRRDDSACREDCSELLWTHPSIELTAQEQRWSGLKSW